MRGSRVCAGLVVGLVALTACGGGTGKRATAWAPARSGLAVDVRTETFVDTRRSTPPNGDEPGGLSRTLVTTILRPAVPGSYPLIVFAHGFTGTPSDYDNLLRAWASAGYVVAAPAFPLSNRTARPAPVRDDLRNQPGDVSFVITEVLRLDDDPASPLHGQVDRLHIAAAGHSMGAATTLGVALNTCCRDNRVTAAAVLSGGDAVYPGGTYPAPDETPVLFEHGTEDESIPIASARKAFAAAMPPKFFVTLDGASHVPPFLGPLDHPDAGVVARSTVDFFDRYLKGVPDGLTRLRNDANVSGTAHLQESVA